ncbi:MAG: alkaline phosphatase family protein [Deltaproteobacteria bacterium]|nr:alkaline phosphatase family protein [Deltaproteobacteria bacterium]
MRILLAVCLVLGASSACTSREKAEAQMRQRRLACAFQAGALPKDTIGDTAFIGKAMPVDHIVLMMQENRSFDHYFSRLTHAGVTTAPADTELVGPGGVSYRRYHETRLCISDLSHSWNGSHRQWNNGNNDGFAEVAGGNDPGRTMGWYDETDLPFYYSIARTFAISDAHHAALLGPTWPNRMFYTAGTSFGVIGNGLPPGSATERIPNIFELLGDHDVDFRIYISDAPTMLMYLTTYTKYAQRVVPLQQYFLDAASGDLPELAMVEAKYTAVEGRDDEHPPSNVQRGQRFTADAVNALIASPAWKRSIMFLTWDEHGGFYDHVPPPAACPTPEAPMLDDEAEPGGFDRLGFRVPLIAISPYSKRGHVSHFVSDLTSVTRFVEARFNLPAMSTRDANAEPLLDLFDFERPVYDVPALAAAEMDAERGAACP